MSGLSKPVDAPVTPRPLPTPAPGDAARLAHELSVHQVELELQNEQLRQTQAELEASRDRYFDLYEHAPIGYVTLEMSGHIAEANRQATLLFGRDRGALIGRLIADFMAPPDRLRLAARLQELMAGAGGRELDLQLANATGQPTWVNVRMTLVPGAGAPKCRIALVDISERVAMQQERARLAAIVASSDDAIVGLDLDGRVLSWNAGAERLFGWRAQEMTGRTLDRLLPPERADEEYAAQRRVRDGERLHGWETERLHRDGRTVALSIGMWPTVDEGGRVVGVSAIARDIGERRRVEDRLRQRLRQLDLLAQASAALIMTGRDQPPPRHALFDRVREAVDAEMCIHYRSTEAPDTLELVSSHGLRDSGRAKLGRVGLKDSLCGIVLRRAKPFVVEDLRASALPEGQILKAEGVRCYAGFPLVAHGRVHGVAAWASTSRDRFDEGELQVMHTVCDQYSAMLERTELLDELQRRERALQAADRRKDDFIATLAHELRNPLAPIRNAVGILRKHRDLDPELAWCRDVIDRQVRQMARLLEDLLDVSRVTRDRIELRCERVQVAALVDAAVEMARPLVQAQRHDLVVSLPTEPLTLHADATRLTQVLANLLNNAAKYTDPGGRIELVARREGDRAVISVRDNGIGIAPQSLPGVFQMFSQQQPAVHRARGGLGIGLSLSRGLVQMHGGRIEAHSGGTGLGSEFVVELPLAPDAEVAPAPSPFEDDPRLAGRRVLVVDDNKDAAETLAATLALFGIEARCAFGGGGGLKAAAEWHPDAVIVDIGMPNLNGYEVCRRLRAEPWGRAMVLVACTGWGQEEDRQRARDAGFDEHLVKPVEPEAVVRAILRGSGRRG